MLKGLGQRLGTRCKAKRLRWEEEAESAAGGRGRIWVRDLRGSGVGQGLSLDVCNCICGNDHPVRATNDMSVNADLFLLTLGSH